jgi:hypothetical protein
MSATILEWSKVQIGEEFVNAICRAKDAAIAEINRISPCLLECDEDHKDNDVDRMVCNLDHMMHVLEHYIKIKHYAEHVVIDDGTVDKIVTKALHKIDEHNRMRELQMGQYDLKERHVEQHHEHVGSIG